MDNLHSERFSFDSAISMLPAMLQRSHTGKQSLFIFLINESAPVICISQPIKAADIQIYPSMRYGHGNQIWIRAAVHYSVRG